MGSGTVLSAALLGVHHGREGVKREIIRANIPATAERALESSLNPAGAPGNPPSDRPQTPMGAKLARTFEDTLGTRVDVKV